MAPLHPLTPYDCGVLHVLVFANIKPSSSLKAVYRLHYCIAKLV